jgi:DNA-binding Lrp family transcriptional regulator
MSIGIMKAVFDNQKDITEATDVLILVCMADWCNDEGVCWPKVKTIAQKTRLSERTIYRRFNHFEKLGWIKREGGTGDSNRYKLTVPEPDTESCDRDSPDTESVTPRTDVSPSIRTINNRHLQKPKKLTPQQSMVGALAKAMNGNSRLMGARLGRLASTLLKEGATPEKVLEMYGAPSSWWYRYHWKGEKGQPPGERDIRQTWDRWDIPKPVNTGTTEDLMSCSR